MQVGRTIARDGQLVRAGRTDCSDGNSSLC